MKRLALVLLMIGALIKPALAVNPDEVLADPLLETRARAISAGLRCMVCQNQSIDDSNAELAKDLRLLVRERIKAGDSDQQVTDYIVSRYGEFVLLKPPIALDTILLWSMPALLLLIGSFVIVLQALRRKRGAAASPLSAEEERQLGEILGRIDDR